ncbi:hypothetical protein A3F55_01560 [Candidatus Adlerbacteria bacterium RIFCSPHIGHO2_12_FULL_53_18]|uniref:Uncharacterized protein n=1 Tax=Candidatus Adlerbacteria bacterium RIFCSPHIGHO2_12_FULL_53_18 TaxID=1797242 RepID=A0A1F4XRK7_9BACT|nr:MAG: hypothetical protein A3F55_01560 [Candidatus Adlerbacteria bacterium RIFCSPHIGHO2_12_FULL_53_18]
MDVGEMLEIVLKTLGTDALLCGAHANKIPCGNPHNAGGDSVGKRRKEKLPVGNSESQNDKAKKRGHNKPHPDKIVFDRVLEDKEEREKEGQDGDNNDD